jgi:diguanylate cyclase (GGDEF)-like protein
MLERAGDDRDATADLLPALVAQLEWNEWADRASKWRVSRQERNDGELTDFLFRGKERFDNYRRAEEHATAYLVARRDQAIRHERIALFAALLATLLMLAAGGVHTRLRRRRLERSILRPMTQLLTTIRSLRSGNLSARSTATGVRELDAVGDALDGLADGLREAGELATAREARLALLARRLETVITVARETSGSPSVQYVAESVAAAAADLLGAPTRLWVRDEDGVLQAVRRSTDPRGFVPPTDLRVPALVASVAAEARADGDDAGRAYPLVLAGAVVGVLETGAASIDDDVEHVLAALLSTAAAGIESARLHNTAREQAELDALTRLPNRRKLEGDLSAEWERAQRYSRPLAFAMLDLDHFKSLNDTYGHLVGDMVLRATASAVGATLRETDTAYRYGGEEFAVLLRETSVEEANAVAERLRAAVAAVTVVGYPVTVTTSIGLAAAGRDMTDQSDVVAAADHALYCAKRAGRNRVETAGGPPASSPRPATLQPA